MFRRGHLEKKNILRKEHRFILHFISQSFILLNIKLVNACCLKIIFSMQNLF